MKRDLISMQHCFRVMETESNICYSAFGMGVDSPCVERTIHFGVPQTMEGFFQESGRAGRDGRPATSTLYFNNNDIGANVEGMQPIMRDYCKNPQNVCRGKIVLSHFGFGILKSSRQTQLLQHNVELTVSALNALSYIKMFWPL